MNITIAQALDPRMGKIVQGIMTKNWDMVGDAFRESAAIYHNQNGLPLHSGLDGLPVKLQDHWRPIVSAVLYSAQENDGLIQ